MPENTEDFTVLNTAIVLSEDVDISRYVPNVQHVENYYQSLQDEEAHKKLLGE